MSFETALKIVIRAAEQNASGSERCAEIQLACARVQAWVAVAGLGRHDGRDRGDVDEQTSGEDE